VFLFVAILLQGQPKHVELFLLCVTFFYLWEFHRLVGGCPSWV